MGRCLDILVIPISSACLAGRLLTVGGLIRRLVPDCGFSPGKEADDDAGCEYGPCDSAWFRHFPAGLKPAPLPPVVLVSDSKTDSRIGL